MTVNYNFDLEDDDFFDSTFLSISENDLLTSTAVSKIVSSNQKPNEHLKENLKQGTPHQQIANSSSSVCGIKENSKTDDFNVSKRTFNDEESREDKQISNLSPIQDSNKNSSIINKRFIPGFTPKTKKRKFPGPAGIYSQQDKLLFLSTCDLDKSSTENPVGDAEVLGILSSQLSANELLLPSWQNLQRDVSSCPAFMSTAKYYSIRRVLNETSKKKLPKHLEVPVLCVLIKKFKHEDSCIMFMDDTGEIPGRIENKAFDAYKDYVKTGTALILRKVTFLCNVLLFQEKSVASIYLEDGSVKHIQELNSILDKEEPLKCPGTPKTNENGVATILKMCDSTLNAAKKSPCSILLNSKTICKTPNISFSKQHIKSSTPNNLSSSWTLPNAQHFSKMLDNIAPIRNSLNVIPSTKQNVSSLSFSKPTNEVANINASCIISKAPNSSVPSNENILNSIPSIPTNPLESDDLFCDGSGMDEFDELLCSLDEKSFLEEI